jgi:NTE family protein
MKKFFPRRKAVRVRGGFLCNTRKSINLKSMKTIGINLNGGGARGSYQAGVLLALGQILKTRNLLGEKNPIKIWSGASAGAINATFCAANADDLFKATEKLALLWREIQPNQVYRTDALSLSKNSVRWIRDLTFGSFFQSKLAQSLLDTSPLLALLNEKIRFSQIQNNLERKIIDSLSCTAYCFNTNKTVSFVQGQSPSWQRSRRHSVAQDITAQHVLASCSIPLLFPLTPLEGQHYGDGGFRNTAPTAPVIHQGAQKILMIGVRYQGPKTKEAQTSFEEPGVAKVAGAILHALFFDNIDLDLERLELVNEIIHSVHQSIQTERSDYSPIDYKNISPSKDIAKIAEQCSKEGFPKMVQYLIDGLGTRKDTADLSSYLLFHSTFTKQLVDLGYADTIQRKDEIEEWICSDH